MSTETDLITRAEPSDAVDQNLDYAADIARLQSLLTDGKVEEARCLVRQLETDWPESELVRRYGRALAPPAARIEPGGKRAPSREQTQQEGVWLREHAHEYSGCWVVLDGDRLIAADSRLRSAMEQADLAVGKGVGSVYYLRALAEP